MTQIICLANSWKHGDRCIAGIETTTGNWIRPISDLDDGRITNNMRLINGKEPALLDILEIPLTENKGTLDFQGENRLIAQGKWKKIGEAKPMELFQYCHSDRYILHNQEKYVLVSELKNKSFSEKKTLQLICATHFSFSYKYRSFGGLKWKGSLTTTTGENLIDATITDPIFNAQLNWGYRPKNPCLVTISLSMPLRPSDWEEEEDPCWKIISAVIELSTFDAILIEMQRLNWSIDRGKNYLEKNYGRRSRQQLNDVQLVEFFNYLKSLS